MLNRKQHSGSQFRTSINSIMLYYRHHFSPQTIFPVPPTHSQGTQLESWRVARKAINKQQFIIIIKLYCITQLLQREKSNTPFILAVTVVKPWEWRCWHLWWKILKQYQKFYYSTSSAPPTTVRGDAIFFHVSQRVRSTHCHELLTFSAWFPSKGWKSFISLCLQYLPAWVNRSMVGESENMFYFLN